MRTAIGFVLGTLIAGTVAASIGYWPTVRLAGRAGAPAMLAGIATAVAASWVGAAPVFFQPAGLRGNAAALVLAGTGIRVFAAAAVGAALAFSGAFLLAPLLVWIAIGYLVLLPVDVLFAIGRLKPGGDKTEVRTQ